MNAWFKDLDGNIVGVISSGMGGPPLEPGAEISAMIAAADLERAKRWYSEKLGFEPDFQFPDVLATYRSGGSTFNVYKTEFAGTAKNTVGVWMLEGLRDEVARLRARGVVFEEYDFGDGGKTVDGILSDAEGDLNAWFKDFEGNILALLEDRDDSLENSTRDFQRLRPERARLRRQRRAHADRQVRRRALKHPGGRARWRGDCGRRGARPAARRDHRRGPHGPGAPGGRRPGAGAEGGAPRRPARDDLRHDDQPRLRLGPEVDHARRRGDQGGRRRGRRRGRHGDR